MSKIQWEYDRVERPFCAQLAAMGWQWIEGDTDVPEFTERQNFLEVLPTSHVGVPEGSVRDEVRGSRDWKRAGAEFHALDGARVGVEACVAIPTGALVHSLASSSPYI
ncbi:MAG: hypothetical protein FJ387_00370 [Verrucomicrobia bacterium]|nr:hypothetical protein [Verrucomicrobiota bacterium]